MVSRILEAAIQFFFAAVIFCLLYKYLGWRVQSDDYLKERLEQNIANTANEDQVGELEMEYEMEIDGRSEDSCAPVGCGCGLIVVFIIGGIAALLGHYHPIMDFLNDPYF